MLLGHLLLAISNSIPLAAFGNSILLAALGTGYCRFLHVDIKPGLLQRLPVL
jgi:hypothetical protein